MTIYGGYDRGDGIILDGFFISCCKCGWHSTIRWYNRMLICLKCGNRHENKNIPTAEEYEKHIAHVGEGG